MAAADSFVGELLNPSPWKEAMAENDRYRAENTVLWALARRFYSDQYILAEIEAATHAQAA